MPEDSRALFMARRASQILKRFDTRGRFRASHDYLLAMNVWLRSDEALFSRDRYGFSLFLVVPSTHHSDTKKYREMQRPKKNVAHKHISIEFEFVLSKIISLFFVSFPSGAIVCVTPTVV